MELPLLDYYLHCQTVAVLRECVCLAGKCPTRSGRKDELIHALLQVCHAASGHKWLWNYLLKGVTKSQIKLLIERRPPPGLRSTWGSNKQSLIATVIRADRPEAVQKQYDKPCSSASLQVPACGVLVPADCSPVVLKGHLCGKWIKAARRQLKHAWKKKEQSTHTLRILKNIMKANPDATVGQVRGKVEEAVSLSFKSGAKYLFFMHHLLRLASMEKGPKRRAPPKQKFRMEVCRKKVTADMQDVYKHVAKQDDPLVRDVLVPWSPLE